MPKFPSFYPPTKVRSYSEPPIGPPDPNKQPEGLYWAGTPRGLELRGKGTLLRAATALERQMPEVRGIAERLKAVAQEDPGPLLHWEASSESPQKLLALLTKHWPTCVPPLVVEYPESQNGENPDGNLAKEDSQAEQAQRSLAAFALLVEPQFELRPVTRFMAARLQDAAERLELGEKVRLVISVPPRTGKTKLLQIFVAWFLGRNPHLSTLTACKALRLAARIGSQVLRYVQSDVFRRVFPKWALSPTAKGKQEFEFSGPHPDNDSPATGHYAVYGRGGSYTGDGGALLNLDDLIGEKETDSEAAIEQAHLAVQALFSRLSPDGVNGIIITNTRYRENDVVGYVTTEYKHYGPWEVLEAPVLVEEEDGPIAIDVPGLLEGGSIECEACEGSGEVEEERRQGRGLSRTKVVKQARCRACCGLGIGLGSPFEWRRPVGDVMAPYTAESVREKRETLLRTNPQEWYGQFKCRPVPRQGNMVDPARLPKFDYTPADARRQRFARVFISVDTSEGKSASGASTAAVVFGVLKAAYNACRSCGGGRDVCMACPACRGSGLGPPVVVLEVVAHPWPLDLQVRVCKALCNRWRADTLLIEDKSTGHSLARLLRAPAERPEDEWVRCPIVLVPVGPGEGKVVRMATCLPTVNDGQVGIPKSGLWTEPSWGLGPDGRQLPGFTPGADWVPRLTNDLLQFPRGARRDIPDAFSQGLNWRTVNPLPAGSWVREEGVASRTPYADASRAASAALQGRALEVF